MPIIVFTENGVEKWLGASHITPEVGLPTRGVGLFETCPFRRHGQVVVGTTGTGPQITYWHEAVPWDKTRVPMNQKTAFEDCLYPVDYALGNNRPKFIKGSEDFLVNDGVRTFFSYDPIFRAYERDFMVLGDGEYCTPNKRYFESLGIEEDEVTEDIAIEILMGTHPFVTKRTHTYPLFLYVPGEEEVTVIEKDGSRHKEPLPKQEANY